MIGLTTIAATAAKLFKLKQLLGLPDGKGALRMALVLAPTILVVGLALVARHQVNAAFEQGKAIGSATCLSQVTAQSALTSASAVVAAAASAASQAQTEIQRAATTGQAYEVKRQRIATHFSTLETEARHAPAQTDIADLCILPDKRLRLWRAANAGPDAGGASAFGSADQSAAPAQPGDTASAAAPARFWPHVRLGGQSPTSGPGLSPVGRADVPVAELPGSAANPILPLN
ncbi:MAG: hypothetical protein RJB60_97 [Pseudomonadota bacterium]|jgi:hypothetical protein